MKKLMIADYKAAKLAKMGADAEMILENAFNEAAHAGYVTIAEVNEQIRAHYNMYSNPCTEDVERYIDVKEYLRQAVKLSQAVEFINALPWTNGK